MAWLINHLSQAPATGCPDSHTHLRLETLTLMRLVYPLTETHEVVLGFRHRGDYARRWCYGESPRVYFLKISLPHLLGYLVSSSTSGAPCAADTSSARSIRATLLAAPSQLYSSSQDSGWTGP
jgi:hypothetical protein